MVRYARIPRDKLTVSSLDDAHHLGGCGDNLLLERTDIHSTLTTATKISVIRLV